MDCSFTRSRGLRRQSGIYGHASIDLTDKAEASRSSKLAHHTYHHLD